MITVSSEVDVDRDKGIFVLAHVFAEDNKTLLNTYAFKSEDIKKHVYIENEVLFIHDDVYEDVYLYFVTSLNMKSPSLNEMTNNSEFFLYKLAVDIREQIKQAKQAQG